ncbi:MAG TPA: flagellar biosynthetic protein FliO [Acidimicrobiales bacterium]|nr:flagellar biosynthetic protein FliO [Acidimicrobiales bacterium]
MQDVSTLALLGRLVLSLTVVLAVMALAARAARKYRLGMGGRRTGAPVEVLARAGLGRRSSVSVIRTGRRTLVVGVTDAAVNLLADLGTEELVEIESDAERTRHPGGERPQPAWSGIVTQLREWTVRRS